VVTESGDIVEYSENSRLTRKEVAKEFIVTRQRALVDFNVEFAVVGKYKDSEGGAGTLWYRFTKLKITILFHLKYKTMDNTIKKGHTPKKKAEIWSDEEKQKLWYLYLDNSDLSCLDLAES
jgi:hypothetical protein